ncbi:hypothetical protein SAMN04489727_8649 [Amycolatopsis tolypomycina]|uniref:Uncharacterized protein n=2 Tax=Amycolatopsis tolypomycina TaxID=208445 RepID=A0A1H5C8C3_9PSEU|nr:hypothetical protein SAMN04489727_8649 [Amycolatopsis tolypomycina]
MPEPNRLLRAARERLPSSSVPGERASRADVADGVAHWLWETTRTRYPFDAHYVAKLERGVVRWPSAAYRAALRHVLSASDDAALGFTPPVEFRRAGRTVVVQRMAVRRRHRQGGHRDRTGPHADLSPEPARDCCCPGRFGPGGRADSVPLAGRFSCAAADVDLVYPGRAGLGRRIRPIRSSLAFGQRLRCTLDRRGPAGLHLRRLKEAPSGTAETRRAFRAGAELAGIVATMAWDEAAHGAAQRYFKLAAQLAHVAGDDALAAVALASLARQCFDLDRPADGLEVVQLAQYATRRTASPRLRAVLATREAWAHAQLGDAPAFRRTVRLAEDYFSEGLRDGDAATPSVRSLDEAELMGVIGARYRDLSRHDVRHAAEAQDYIGRAIALRDPDRVRNRVFDLVGLARAHLITREPERAAELIGMAMPDAAPWTSGRVGVKLRDFHREAGTFATVPAVRDIREVVAAKLAV